MNNLVSDAGDVPSVQFSQYLGDKIREHCLNTFR